MNFTIVRYDSVASTNDEAASMARMGGPEGLCIVATEQTEGRGREGREWVSKAGTGLYVSVVLRPGLETRFYPVIPLLGAVAVYDAIEQTCGEKPDIKWPNDILIKGKKISGILAETCETDIGLAVILGIGINLTSAGFEGDLERSATAIEDIAGSEADCEALLRALTHYLSVHYDELESESAISELLKSWSLRSSFASGKEVTVKTRNESIAGTTEGLDPLGSLLVRTADGNLITVTAGDVETLREQAPDNP